MTAESYTDELIVLQVKNWQTADKQVVCLTKEHGKVVFLAYGARYVKSTAGRLLQPFACLQAAFYGGSRVDKLKSCELSRPMPQFTLLQLAYASLMAEVTEQLTEPGEPAEGIYELLDGGLALLPQKNPRLVALAYILQLLDLCGIGPVYEVCVSCSRPAEGDNFFSYEQGGLICPECRARKAAEEMYDFREATRRLWQQLRLLCFAEPEPFSVKGRDLMELEQILHGFLLYQTDRPLKSLDFLRQITGASAAGGTADRRIGR